MLNKKNNRLRTKMRAYKITSAALLILLSMSLNANNFHIKKEWGSSIENITKTIPEGIKTMQFNPASQPDYTNKIMNYVLAIDPQIVENIIIMRLASKPQTDCMFIKNKLYSLMEDWKTVDAKEQKNILDSLSKEFGQSNLQREEDMSIYSFSNENTKVLFYVKKLTSNEFKCKTYFYTKKLFRMLMME